MKNKPSEKPQSGTHRALIGAILALATACANPDNEDSKVDLVRAEIGGKPVELLPDLMKKMLEVDKKMREDTGEGLDIRISAADLPILETKMVMVKDVHGEPMMTPGQSQHWLGYARDKENKLVGEPGHLNPGPFGYTKPKDASVVQDTPKEDASVSQDPAPKDEGNSDLAQPGSSQHGRFF